MINKNDFVKIPSFFAVLILIVLTLSFAGGATAQKRQAVNASPSSTSNSIQTTAAATTITVDGNAKHQTMEGFGATTLTLANGKFAAAGYDDADNMNAAVRARAIEALYGQVKLTMGNIQLLVLEQAKNDDDDPFNLNWKNLDTREAVFMKKNVVDLGKPYGFDNYSLTYNIDLRYLDWLLPIRAADYNRYLDECAEHVAAGALNWKTINGSLPRTLMLFNEPSSGNGELKGGGAREIIDIIKRTGARLQKEGLNIKFIVPNEGTEAASLEMATAILADPEARKYVAAIGYHPYPYGSTYASIPQLFKTSGSGKPDAGRIETRRQLRELGRRYNVQLWMTEVSHGEVPFDSMDSLRGRAINIHDELEYADAAAFFGMLAMWDTKTHGEHTGGGRPFESESDAAVLIDDAAAKVTITGMGYAIGHYARFVERGATRVEAASGNPLVLTSAFGDEKRRRVTLVIINNGENTGVNIKLNNLPTVKTFNAEQSAGTANRWQKLSPVNTAAASGNFTMSLPARSVTTLAGQF